MGCSLSTDVPLLSLEFDCVLGSFLALDLDHVRVLIFHKYLKMFILDHLFYLVLKGSTFFNIVTNHSMITTILRFISSWGRSVLSQ